MLKSFLLITLIQVFASPIILAQADHWTSGRPDGHAPISVMGDHYHEAGEWMFSYRFMPMSMEGLLMGSDEIDNSVVLQNHMAVPESMQMNMHMVGVMYAPADFLTLMLMGSYRSNSMDLSAMDHPFSTSSAGVGDPSLSALFRLFNRHRQSLHGALSISVPLGSIDERSNTPMMTNAPVAYPMQIGSGTWDPAATITYLGQGTSVSWGMQGQYIVHTGNSSKGYRLGDAIKATAWGAYRASNSLSFSVGLYYSQNAKIKGANPEFNPMMMPLFDTQNSGRKQLDVGIGTNLYHLVEWLSGLRFAAEIKLPVWQSVSGIQMKNQWVGILGLQYTLSHH